MSYRIQDLDKEEYLKICQSWLMNSWKMMDGVRNADIMQMMGDGFPFYRTRNPNVYFWLSSVLQGHMAEFHVLNSEGKSAAENVQSYFPTIREIFTEHNLQRLTIAVPEKFPQLAEYARKLKFVKEGTIRKGALVDGEFGNLTLMGLLKEDIPAKEQRYRKRNKTRRKRPNGNKSFKKYKTKSRTETKAA